MKTLFLSLKRFTNTAKPGVRLIRMEWKRKDKLEKRRREKKKKRKKMEWNVKGNEPWGREGEGQTEVRKEEESPTSKMKAHHHRAHRIEATGWHYEKVRADDFDIII